MVHVLPSGIKITCCYFFLHVYSFPIKSISAGLKHLSVSGNDEEIAEVFGDAFS